MFQGSVISHFENKPNFAYDACTRKVFMADLETVSWDNFVLLPKIIPVYVCNGTCSIYHTDSVYYAYLTQFSNLKDKHKRLCCVPVSFYSMPIMFYNKFDDIVIKVYNDIIVKKCSCR